MSSSHRPGSPHNIPSARDLRQRQTAAEELLWQALRGRRLHGLKFRRQHPVGPFVLDFCCVECRLGIELDGAIHAGQEARDAERSAILADAGYRILRFPNDDLRNDLPGVLRAIHAAAREEPMPRPPEPGRRAGWH
jgi:very-short-patch-repair endonuclease